MQHTPYTLNTIFPPGGMLVWTQSDTFGHTIFFASNHRSHHFSRERTSYMGINLVAGLGSPLAPHNSNCPALSRPRPARCPAFKMFIPNHLQLCPASGCTGILDALRVGGAEGFLEFGGEDLDVGVLDHAFVGAWDD